MPAKQKESISVLESKEEKDVRTCERVTALYFPFLTSCFIVLPQKTFFKKQFETDFICIISGEKRGGCVYVVWCLSYSL